MGIFNLFRKNPLPEEDKENPTIRKIVNQLEALPEKEAKYLAAFAYSLGRIAHADLEISDTETKKMEEIVKSFGGIDPDMAILIVQIAKSQNILFGSTENYLVVREFKKISDPKQRESLMHCLFAVAGADEEITGVEDQEIRQISKELGFSHRDFIDIRSHYREKLTVLKNLPL